MDPVTLRQYETLSPFEIKNDLAKIATRTAHASQVAYLNAGRGNPNWIATEPRSAFFLLGQFAVTESQRTMDLPGGLGGMPKAAGAAARLASWLAAHADMPGATFLRDVIPWAVTTFQFQADAFVHELVDSIIGDNYPVPDRMLVHNEKIVREYLQWAMCGEPRPAGTFELYAVEGGTAAMCYLFKSLKANRLLNPGDTIALATPIFTPYLEMPHLEDYNLKTVFVPAPQENRWQFTDEGLKVLLDPKVKAFFVVNPGNPYAVALSKESIAKVGAILERRPDLLLLTDDVYGTFVDGFRSLLGAFPRNTIGVYSYSKYFGCTGWRLGVIALHEHNIFDEKIAAHDETIQQALDKRYAGLTLQPRGLRFIDRIVADSRDVALNHTAGLSLPQQVMMALFSLAELHDDKKVYQKACIDVVRTRVEQTIEGLGIHLNPNPLFDWYYGLIDFEFWLRKYGGDDVVTWVKANVHPLDIVFRLAEDHGIVLLNGGGFEAPDWSVRVSFANLDGDVYHDIGRAVRAVARSYVMAFQASQAAAAAPAAPLGASGVVESFIGVLRHHPEVTFFLVLGVGYLLGKMKLGGFTLGAVTGTLLAGVAIGQLGVQVSGEVKQCFFLLFLFSIGFRTGPQFFRGLKSDGLQQAALSAIVATTGLLVAYVVSRMFGYDAGTAAGVIAGALTESATIGTASDAIGRLGLSPGDAAALVNRIPVAFAVTYLIGVVGAAWFLAQVGPRIMGIDLEEECRRYEREMGGEFATVTTARRDIEYRAYAVPAGSPLIGRRVRDLETSASDARLFIERIRRGDDVVEPDEATTVRAGDVLAVTGRREQLVAKIDEQRLGIREVDDRPLLDIPAEALDVVVTEASVDGRTLAELATESFARSVFLRRLARGGTSMAMLPNTTVQRGDVLTIVGPSRRLADAVQHIGAPDRPTDAADMVLVAFGIVAGALLGLPALMLGGIEIGLSLSVGVLLGGLVCGWLRSTWPRFFGRIPGPTLWMFESIGLAGFVAVVGLDAGPDFVTGLRTSGVTLIVAGLFTVLVPHLVGIVVGRWVFKMQPGVLLGVCAGAGTATPALAAIQETAKSAVPTLGYGVSYAVGNVLLAVWGTVIVALLR